MKLIDILRDFKKGHLDILALEGVDLAKESASDLASLVETIKTAPKLKEISLFGMHLWQVQPENLVPIFEAIHVRSTPLAINLAANDLGLAPELFSDILSRLLDSPITTLAVGSNKLSHLPRAAIEHLCTNAIDNNSLEKLELSSNQLGESETDNLLLFGQLILKCKKLKSLNLSDNALGKNVKIIGFLSLLSQLSLFQLDLTTNDLCDLYRFVDESGEGTFFTCLTLIAQHHSLLDLSLADNTLCAWGTDYLELFFSKILENKKLRTLDLNVNQFEVLVKEEGDKDFLDKFTTFVKKSSGFGLSVKYENGNFDTREELDGIVEKSGVLSAFWRARHPHLTLDDISKLGFDILRTNPLLQRALQNSATRALFLTKVGELFASAHESELNSSELNMSGR